METVAVVAGDDDEDGELRPRAEKLAISRNSRQISQKRYPGGARSALKRNREWGFIVLGRECVGLG